MGIHKRLLTGLLAAPGSERGRLSRTSGMRKPTEKRLVDKMIAAYVDWRDACRRERDAYRSWMGATESMPRSRSCGTNAGSSRTC